MTELVLDNKHRKALSSAGFSLNFSISVKPSFNCVFIVLTQIPETNARNHRNFQKFSSFLLAFNPCSSPFYHRALTVHSGCAKLAIHNAIL